LSSLSASENLAGKPHLDPLESGETGALDWRAPRFIKHLFDGTRGSNRVSLSGNFHASTTDFELDL
jgi:hypothetical protein